MNQTLPGAQPPAPLVSTQWLAARMAQPGLAVIDASWYLPAMRRDAKAEHAAAHIPGAVFFDLDAVSDRTSDLPHMLPSDADFAAAMGALGVSDEMEIVVYDGAGLFSAPRVWWTLTTFGARKVHVLDGGLPKWVAEGRPIESGSAQPAPASFRAQLDREAVASFEDVRAALDTRSAQVADARPAQRFGGEAPEPRPGVPSGHMPGARSLPASDLTADGRLKSIGALRAEFARAGVDPSLPIIASCGSGVSAATINLALAVMGLDVMGLDVMGKAPTRLYDGSWTEWAGKGGATITQNDS